MAHIYVYSPSGAVQNQRDFHRGVRRLQALGHEVELDADALTRWQRFAGDDDTRLAAIRRAACSGADLAMISRGGYGITRLLPQMPWELIQQGIEAGTRFMGFSDFTVVHLGLLAQNACISWAGPALCEGFGQPNSKQANTTQQPDDLMLACFDDFLSRSGEGTGWRLKKPDLLALGQEDLHLAEDATLWGGNLAMLVSLLGTPWWPGIKNGVLFLEDVAEHPYRIERMLLQLLHAGVLDQQKAVLLGQFTEYKSNTQDRGFKLQGVIDNLRQQTQTPLITGLPFGHVPKKVLLPVGASVNLFKQDHEILLLWGHLH